MKQTESQKRYYAKNRDKINKISRESRRKLYAINPEKIKEANKRYIIENKPKIQNARKLYRLKHGEELRLKSREYAKTHKEERKDYVLKKTYGITLGEYRVLSESQNDVCAICEKPQEIKRGKNLFVDHNHDTGKVRGLLCTYCNVALGYLREDVIVMEKMIKYVKKHN